MPLDDLLRRVRDREPRSLHTLMEEHGPHVYNLALRITGSEAHAEELVREVFLDLPDALYGFDGHDFPAWLTKLATRRAYRHGRPDDSEPATEADGVRGRDLETAIANLENDQRIVFVLKEVEGLSHDEVASALGISAGLSRVRLHRARKALSEHFQAVNLGMKHPTQFMISRYVDGDLPTSTRDPIAEHFEVCTSCRCYVGWLRDLQHLARTLRLPRPLPPHIAEGLSHRRRHKAATPED